MALPQPCPWTGDTLTVVWHCDCGTGTGTVADSASECSGTADSSMAVCFGRIVHLFGRNVYIFVAERRNVHVLSAWAKCPVVVKSVHKHHRLELPQYVIKPPRASKNHHSHSFQNIRAQSDQYLHSFLPRTIRTWNLLPQDIVAAPSPDSFRSKLVKSIKDGAIVIGGKCTGSRQSHPILAF